MVPHVSRPDWRGLASLSLLAFAFVAFMVNLWGTDAHAYWGSFRDGLYSHTWQDSGAWMVYPPPAVLVVAPLTLLPFPAFYALLTAGSMAALVWLVGWRWAGFAVVLYPPAMIDLLNGNIHILLAAALVAGAWPALLLTKFTTGVGLLAPLLERRWRLLAWTVGVTAALCLLSIAILGVGVWRDYFAMLSEGAGRTQVGHAIPLPFLVRLPFAVALVAAATRWRWLLPFGVMLALPAVWWSSLALLVAVPRLAASAAARQPAAPRPAPALARLRPLF